LIISIIVAKSSNDVIGINNKLPWRLSGDLKKFKSLTMGHHLLLGRKTYESIGRPLPGRTMLVLSSQDFEDTEFVKYFKSIDSALQYSRGQDEDELFVIGGAKLYEQMLSISDRLYLSSVKVDLDGDAYFPILETELWIVDEISLEKHPQDDKNQFPWTFQVLNKK
jgi:dihydrofolate reductase